MASHGSSADLHGSYELHDSHDDSFDDPSLNKHAPQIMQIDLAREIVRDMQRAARTGKKITLGFGKRLVCVQKVLVPCERFCC